MASKAELALILSLVDDVSKTAKGVKGGLLDLGATSGGVQSALVGVAKIGMGAIIGASAAVIGAVSGIGAASFAAAMQIDDAMDTIAIGTGMVGDELAGMGGTLREVLWNTASDASTVAGVMTELNSRLGVTDDDLRGLTISLTEMSRMMGTDATQNAALFTRTLGDAGIGAEDGAALLDTMFKATQITGVGFEDLNQKMVQFGAPMRLMGFTITDSIALFAKWEKEGVNAELAMGSLRIAAGKFAKAGKPLRASLLETFESIQSNADASEALALGMEVFGARAGPDMTAAIREGRFAIDDLVAQLGDAEGAILDASRATEDWPEKLARAKNRIMVIIAPIGDALMGLAGKGLDYVMPMLDDLAGLIEANVIPAIAKIGPVIDIFFQGLENGKGPLESFKDVLWTLLPPGMAADLTGAIGWVQQLVADAKAGDWNAVGGAIWTQVQTAFTKAIAWGGDVIGKLADTLFDALGATATYKWTDAGLVKSSVWEDIGAALWRNIRLGFEGAVSWGSETLEKLRVTLSDALGLTADGSGEGQVTGTWGQIGANIASSVVAGVKSYFFGSVEEFKAASQSFLAWSESKTAQDELEQIGANMAGGVFQGFKNAIYDFKGWPSWEDIPALNWIRGIANIIGRASSGYEERTGTGKFAAPGGLPATRPFGDLKFNANGTDWWRGGPTWVGERGPEIVSPPAGSQIYSNEESRGMVGGTTINIAAGAIVVHSLDPDRAGIGVLRELRSLGVPVGV